MSQPLLEGPPAEADAPLDGLVVHVQAEDLRQAHLGDLRGEEEGPPEVLGVGDLEHRHLAVAEQQVAGHPLVLGHRVEAVRPGGVDDGQRRPPITALPVATSTVVPG